jgi:hypothetical protein
MNTMSRRNAIDVCHSEPIFQMPRFRAAATRYAPKIMPAKLPIPPTTTAVMASSTTNVPIVGARPVSKATSTPAGAASAEPSANVSR